jgi:predicted dehydrogenase
MLCLFSWRRPLCSFASVSFCHCNHKIMLDLQIHPILPQHRDLPIGILGSGFIVNECHLVAYRKAGFNPVAIASRNRERAAAVAQRHGVPHVYDNYQLLLDDPAIQVLDIAVPPNAQIALIREACRRRTVKGVLAQKPLGMNYREAAEAVSLCKEAGIILVVNQNMRYDHSVRAAKALLDGGHLGEPVLATIDMRGIPHWMPWHRELRSLTLRVMSIHHLDTFRYWFGDPDNILCSVRSDPRTEFPHTDGICTYILEYAHGLRCVGIDDPWTGPAREGCPADLRIQWRIEGTRGLAIGDLGWCKEPHTTPSTIRYASIGDRDFHRPAWEESWFPDAFIGPMAQLLVALETGTPPALSGQDNLQTVALVDAAYASAGNGRAVSPADIIGKRALVEFAQSSAGFPSLSDLGLGASPGQAIRSTPPLDLHNLTPRAQHVLRFARGEARRLHHYFVGTEHLLLGLLRLGQGTAADLLHARGLTLEIVSREIEKQVGPGPEQAIVGTIPITPRTRKVLSLAAREASAEHRSYVGTEHILLGLLLDGDGIAARVLCTLGLDLEGVRGAIATA